MGGDILLIYGLPYRATASAAIYTGAGFIFSMLIGTDTVNDPVVSVHDAVNGDTAANEIIPSNTYDASILGINGAVFHFAKHFSTGLYVKIANIGSGSVVIDYRPQTSTFPPVIR